MGEGRGGGGSCLSMFHSALCPPARCLRCSLLMLPFHMPPATGALLEVKLLALLAADVLMLPFHLPLEATCLRKCHFLGIDFRENTHTNKAIKHKHPAELAPHIRIFAIERVI